ncbi:PTS sugar transporter subunit IIC [Faecalibacillus intestinalis]|uniref:PTS sugar transporter subunit IIC n=1 Tax=Faecalibacillus intestinalis TaxID=1982626 RepID=UPI003994AF39
MFGWMCSNSALVSQMDPGQAVVLAMPFGLIGVLQDQLRKIINALFFIEQINGRGWKHKEIERCAIVYPVILGFFLRFPIVFAITYAGAVQLKYFASMPEWITWIKCCRRYFTSNNLQ